MIKATAMSIIVAIVVVIGAVQIIERNNIDHAYDMEVITWQYETLNNVLIDERAHISALIDTIKFMDEQYAKKRTAHSIITFYHPGTGGINADSDPTKTATGTRPIAGKTCAISASLVRKGWLGRKIYIEGYGVFIADDRMSVSLKGHRIDICAPTLRYALKGGSTPNILCSPLN